MMSGEADRARWPLAHGVWLLTGCALAGVTLYSALGPRHTPIIAAATRPLRPVVRPALSTTTAGRPDPNHSGAAAAAAAPQAPADPDGDLPDAKPVDRVAAYAVAVGASIAISLGRWLLGSNGRTTAKQCMAATTGEVRYPDFVSPEALAEISEPEALRALRHLKRVPIAVPTEVAASPILTSFLGPAYPGDAPEAVDATATPLVLLHGFDSNCLEWRHVLPLLTEKGIPTYAFDILGWGFAERDPNIVSYSPEAKRRHLYEFWRQQLKGRPMVLAGASVGGAMAVDFASHYPEAVARLILVAPQCFIDGVPRLPTPLALLGIQLLKAAWLRNVVTEQAYNTKDFGDAMRIGRLHCLMSGYDASAVSFIQSGGYSVSQLVPRLKLPVLVIWGRQDQILPPAKYLGQLQTALPDAQVVFIEDSGHVPHCIRPAAFVDAVAPFVTAANPLSA